MYNGVTIKITNEILTIPYRTRVGFCVKSNRFNIKIKTRLNTVTFILSCNLTEVLLNKTSAIVNNKINKKYSKTDK